MSNPNRPIVACPDCGQRNRLPDESMIDFSTQHAACGACKTDLTQAALDAEDDDDDEDDEDADVEDDE